MADSIRDRIKSKIPSSPGAEYKGPPVPADPTAKLRGSIDRAKQRISTMPKTPQAAGQMAGDILQNRVVNPLVQQAQQRMPSLPQVPNQTPPAANPDRGLIINWIKQQPAFTWLQTVLSQYGVDLREILPSRGATTPGVPGDQNMGPFGVSDGSTEVSGPNPLPILSPLGTDMTQSPFTSQPNQSGFTNPGFPR